MNLWPQRFPLFPDSASALAREVDAIYFFALGVTAFFSLLIAALILRFATKYRRRAEEEVGHPESAANWLEIAWSVIPLGILLFMFGWGAKVYFEVRRPPADAVEYFVTAKQWMWKFQHPEGNRQINHLDVPLGQAIKLTMTSEDVIHSFFVPAFRAKADVIPGRYTTFWFRADRTGTFPLFCAEYCGAEHSLMTGSVRVLEPHEYEAWLRGSRPQQTLAATGEQLFAALDCQTCHRGDSAARAPILHGIFGRTIALASGGSTVADENYFRESILFPAAKVVRGYEPVMPTYMGRVSEEELVKLISYIKSLPPAGGAQPVG